MDAFFTGNDSILMAIVRLSSKQLYVNVLFNVHGASDLLFFTALLFLVLLISLGSRCDYAFSCSTKKKSIDIFQRLMYAWLYQVRINTFTNSNLNHKKEQISWPM